MDDKGKENELELHEKGNSDEETLQKKLPYPKSVFFIVSNEFCERFSYYGMRTILSLYLVDVLLFNETDAKVIYHVFTMLVYFFPVFGAMLADSLLGKFNTILYVSMIYAVGNFVLAMAAAPPLNFPEIAISMVGLILIAMGTGGIKPCVAAFGGDQFKLPQQQLQLAKFFSMFYFSINAGSLISTFITPLLREDVHCFDNDHCYSLAFGVPGILMVISIIIFGLGKPLYRIRQPEGNMVIRVSKCITNAIRVKSKSKGEKKEHWLDYSEAKFGKKLVDDIKATLKVLVLFLPLPIFWTLFDQQGTGWTFQARRMNGDIGFYIILPDQMQVINPLLILAFIPLFEYAIYPALDKLKILRSPLQRLVTGGVLAAIAFAISACISLALESEMPTLPHAGNGHIRLYNNLPCDLKIESEQLNINTTINSMNFYEDININVINQADNDYIYTSDCGASGSGSLSVYEEKASGYYFADTLKPMAFFYDSNEKEDKGYPRVRTLVNENNFPIENQAVKYLNDKSIQIDTNISDVSSYDLKPNDYTIKIGDSSLEVKLKLGAVYTVLAFATSPSNFKIKVVEVTAPSSVHMLLLIPQYVIITMGEIMYSITGLEFSYSQAPSSMKSVLQACWLLTTAFGNLIIVIISSAQFFEKDSANFFLYAGLMLADMLIFALLAMRYKYVTPEESDSETDSLQEKSGIDNTSFVKDDK